MSAFTTTRRVEFRDTDTARMMHFTAFFTMMEEVEHEFLRSLDLSVMLHDEIGPISWPRVAAKCDFHSAVKFEDVLDVALDVGRIGEKSVTYRFAFSHQGRRVATGELTSVCCRVSHDAPPVSIPIPEWFAGKLRAAAEGGAA